MTRNVSATNYPQQVLGEEKRRGLQHGEERGRCEKGFVGRKRKRNKEEKKERYDVRVLTRAMKETLFRASVEERVRHNGIIFHHVRKKEGEEETTRGLCTTEFSSIA